jgi:hypothetical protein
MRQDLTDLRERMEDGFRKVDDRFRKVNDGFTEIGGRLDGAAAGQAQIAALLNTLIE